MTSQAPASKTGRSAPGWRAGGTWNPSEPSGSSEPSGKYLCRIIKTGITLSNPKSVHVGTHPDEGRQELEGWRQEPLDEGRQEDEGEGDPDDGVHDARRLPRVGQGVDVAIT